MTVNTYERAVLKTEKLENQRRLDEHNRQAWERILDTTDQTPGQAFFDRVVEWCGGVLTTDKYDLLCATSALPEFSDRKWHAGTLDFYIQKVIDKLRDHKWSDDDIRRKAAELWNKNKAQVRAYLNELGFREVVRTVDEARDYLQRHRLDVASRQYFAPDGSGPYPRLPMHIVPQGFVTAVKLDAKYLNELASQDMAAFQKMVRRYHVSQINERLSQTASSLQGESQC